MTNFVQIQAWTQSPLSIIQVKDSNFQSNPHGYSREINLTLKRQFELKHQLQSENGRRGRGISRKQKGVICNGLLFPVDPWAPTVDSQSIASQLFAFSLFPYMGFLYFITKSKSAPKLTLFGFYFLLAFVGATIPAGIYAKVHYGTSLSNVDWLHGGAESLLTLTNIFIVLGLREALRKDGDENEITANSSLGVKEDEKSSI